MDNFNNSLGRALGYTLRLYSKSLQKQFDKLDIDKEKEEVGKDNLRIRLNLPF